MERARVVDIVERGITASPPSVSVRICKGCGKHYVALMRWKAEAEAMRLSREALGLIRADGPEARKRMQELTQEAHLTLWSTEGYCRACGLDLYKQRALS